MSICTRCCCWPTCTLKSKNWLRIASLVLGWLLILIGIAGLFLPVLQGGLSLALGLATLSISSQWIHLRLRALFGRWPGLWKRMERLRRRVHRWLRRRDGQEPDAE